MKKVHCGFLLLFISTICNAQKATAIKVDRLTEILNYKNDTTYIVNFWATWCKPCIEELPHFLEAEKELAGKKFKFIYVSLDFKRELDTRLNKYLKDKNINSTVYLIDEPDYNKWIDLVSPEWQGNIPATVIYNFIGNSRGFYPKDFEREELRKILGL